MNYDDVIKMISSIEKGNEENIETIRKSIIYVYKNKDCRLARKLAYCFGEESGNNHAWALEMLLKLDFCPQASAQAIKFLCRKGFFEKHRDLILEWAAVAPSRETDTSKKSMSISMIGDRLRETKDKFLRDFVAEKIEHYMSINKYELSPYECSEKHSFQQAAAEAMGADMEKIMLCDDIYHSNRLEEYWAKKFLAERIDG